MLSLAKWQELVSKNESSSVARGGARRGLGGLEPPIGLKSMQNSLFLSVLSLIFGPKTKIAPPQKVIEVKLGKEAEML